LDEPINGLDPQGIIDVRNVIKDIRAQTGTTFIISSHILAELDLLATRFGFIEGGVLLEEISREELHEKTDKKLLVIEVDDEQKACKALTDAGVKLYDVHRQETALEDYFMRLIGGARND